MRKGEAATINYPSILEPDLLGNTVLVALSFETDFGA